ncbi:UNVERIFIED_CONTAM: putative protein phosphatase 2C 25 [Sesamum radiatum]|uniref:protein-serine/threonine phosphatase n=1 Tax=Sesamum radiatum TaxID=300843 RepID=A0AAW2NEE5_SESRA
MPCAVAAVSTSPMFTPSPRKLSPIFCKSAASPPPPPPPSSLSSPSRLGLKHIGKPLSGGGDQEVGPSKVVTMTKRKRPARIDIPVMNIGFDNERTISDFDRLNEVEIEGEGYSVYCKRGKRGGVMEDRYAAVLCSEGDSKQAFFGVFDGHGGAGAAEFAAKNLEKNVMNGISKRSEVEIEEAVKEGYLTTDAEFLKEDIRGGVAEALTVDHRPSLNDEKERIESLGGYVDCCRGVWRVHGSLAVSRSIGDRHLKQWVIAEPATKVLKISPECEFLILASDGLWDKVSNQEAVDVVRPLCTGVEKPEAFSACKKLVDLSLARGSADDTSVMVIQLSQFLN